MGYFMDDGKCVSQCSKGLALDETKDECFECYTEGKGKYLY